MGGPVYGGLQGPGVPSMIAQFPTLKWACYNILQNGQ